MGSIQITMSAEPSTAEEPNAASPPDESQKAECPFCVMMRKGGCEVPFKVCARKEVVVARRAALHSARMHTQKFCWRVCVGAQGVIAAHQAEEQCSCCQSVSKQHTSHLTPRHRRLWTAASAPTSPARTWPTACPWCGGEGFCVLLCVCCYRMGCCCQCFVGCVHLTINQPQCNSPQTTTANQPPPPPKNTTLQPKPVRGAARVHGQEQGRV